MIGRGTPVRNMRVARTLSLVIVDFDRVPHAVNPEYSTFDVLHDYPIVTYLLRLFSKVL